MEINKIFSERLRELRTQSGLSQAQLAQKIAIPQSSIAEWEIGKREPLATAIVKIANFFDVSTDYLLGRTDV